jgi:hypothetical protein
MADDDIDCYLANVKLSDSPTYEALSYTWGPPTPTRSIHVGSEHYLEIRENLFTCLLALRETTLEPRALWIDALCINQNDPVEKGHEVKLMPRIYNTAIRALVWLGPATRDSEMLLDWVKRLPSRASSFHKHSSDIIRAKDLFLRRPYWTRTWIIQELFMAKGLFIMCGADTLTDVEFYKLLRELSAMATMGPHDKRAISLALEARPVRVGDRYCGRRSLADLLLLYWDTDCADARDKVYAFIGILPPAGPRESLEVDYSLSPMELLKQVQARIGLPSAALGALRRALRVSWSTLLTGSGSNADTTLDAVKDLYLGEGQLISNVRASYQNAVGCNRCILRGWKQFESSETSWTTGCAIQPGDFCFPTAKEKNYAILIRSQQSSLELIGGAFNSTIVPNLFIDTHSLQHDLLDMCRQTPISILSSHSDSGHNISIRITKRLFDAFVVHDFLCQNSSNPLSQKPNSEETLGHEGSGVSWLLRQSADSTSSFD